MRRLVLVVCVGTAAVASGVAFQYAAGGQADRQPAVRGVIVNVDIRCLPNNGVTFTVVPWRAKLIQGDTIAWVLHEDAEVPLLTITPKQPASWPFDEFKKTGKRGDAPKAKRMKAATPKRRPFPYSVTAVCPRADGTTSSVIIDPDIIII